jgi:DNA-binding response OmpR family regulator
MARIMIIDDDVDLADQTAEFLSCHGHEVRTRYTTEGALEELSEDRPDLVILDLMFPDNPVAGFELARRIRRSKLLKNLPVILLTAVNEEFPVDFSPRDIDSEWMPAQDFIEKPVDLSLLLHRIAEVLKRAG